WFNFSRSDFEAVAVLGATRLRVATALRCRSWRWYHAPRNVSTRARPASLSGGLRATESSARRRSLWRESQSPVQAFAISSHSQTIPGRYSGHLPEESGRHRNQSRGARYPLRGGELGITNAWRLGDW